MDTETDLEVNEKTKHEDKVPSSNLLSGDGYILSQIRKTVSDFVRKGTK